MGGKKRTASKKEPEGMKRSKSLSKKVKDEETKQPAMQRVLGQFLGMSMQDPLKAKYNDISELKKDTLSIWSWNINGLNAVVNKGSF